MAKDTSTKNNEGREQVINNGNRQDKHTNLEDKTYNQTFSQVHKNPVKEINSVFFVPSYKAVKAKYENNVVRDKYGSVAFDVQLDLPDKTGKWWHIIRITEEINV